MLEGIKNKVKSKLTLSDSQLAKATKLAKWAKWYSTSGVWFWGGAVAIGGAAVGLQAVGVPVPATLGTASIVTGAVMTVKSWVLERLFKSLEEKGEKEALERRGKQGGLTPVPEQPSTPALAQKPAARLSFNPKAALGSIKSKLENIHLPKFPRSKTAKPA